MPASAVLEKYMCTCTADIVLTDVKKKIQII